MRKFTFMLLTTLFLSSCSHPPELSVISGYAQGTTFTVKYWITNDEKAKNNNTDKSLLTQSINQEIARIDKLMSNYRDDSVIELFNQQKTIQQPLAADKEIMTLLEISSEVYEKSQHCYDPTIKPLFQIWGFSDDKLNIPNQNTINHALAAIGFDKIVRDSESMTKLHPDVTVDLSAIGQGYAVTKVSELLEKQGIKNYMVEIGGEMLVAGTKPEGVKWQIGIERPVPNSKKISEVITVSGKERLAVMTSGTYRHYFDESGKQYSHILDPRTGKPVTHQSVAVTVLMNNATYADAWSTALLCLGSKQGLAVANKYNVAAVFYDEDDNKELQRLPSVAASNTSENWEIGK